MPQRRFVHTATALVTATLLGACGSLFSDAAGSGAAAPPHLTVYAVTDNAELIKFSAAQPSKVLDRKPLQGLAAGERLVGIDFRMSRGVLYALTSGGRLHTLDVATGQLKPVGNGAPVVLPSGRIGFDFNPAADRIRVVGSDGANLRLHPDTGARAAIDPELHYAPGDPSHALSPRITAAAYTYNKKDDKLTTNYAIDTEAGTLVTQGTLEGSTTPVSPNTGRLYTVGKLGVGTLEDASFDIADVDNSAVAALRQRGRTQLHRIDLATGRAQVLGMVGEGRALWGLAIEP